ncbi:MAG: aldo/keto reductase [Candidatus Methanofastidiosia archaeon]|jgi:aryl-alcohol dehydrogenase-like predicted oxidoreductase
MRCIQGFKRSSGELGDDFVNTPDISRVPLGVKAEISPLGIGTWSWGDQMIWGYGHDYNEEDLKKAFYTCIQHGINFFDTAEAYGWGQSERLLGQFVKEYNQNVVVATKFLPSPWRLRTSSLLHALQNSLNRLGMSQVDLYQFHKHFPPVSFESWMDSLVIAVEKGHTKAVGISNCDKQQMLQAADILNDHGIPLTSNQVEFSLLNREPEETSLLDACRQQGVTLLAYSPLAMGLLTGKYTPENPPSNRFSIRERLALWAYSVALPECSAAKACQFGKKELVQIQPLITVMQEIGNKHNKTCAQVALNWVTCKGAVPIVGVKNKRQAEENVGSLGWSLTASEVSELDEASEAVQLMCYEHA